MFFSLVPFSVCREENNASTEGDKGRVNVKAEGQYLAAAKEGEDDWKCQKADHFKA